VSVPLPVSSYDIFSPAELDREPGGCCQVIGGCKGKGGPVPHVKWQKVGNGHQFASFDYHSCYDRHDLSPPVQLLDLDETYRRPDVVKAIETIKGSQKERPPLPNFCESLISNSNFIPRGSLM